MRRQVRMHDAGHSSPYADGMLASPQAARRVAGHHRPTDADLPWVPNQEFTGGTARATPP